MDFELQRDREYLLKVNADEFEQLLEAHDDILLLEGEPRRQRGRDRDRARYFAWRTGPDQFTLTSAGSPIDYGEMDPPVLTFDFAQGEEGALVQVKSKQFLGTLDGLAQTSLQVTQGAIFWLDRLRWWFSISFLSGLVGLMLWSSLPSGWLATLLGWSVFVASQVAFVKWHLENQAPDVKRLSWQLEHAALTKVVGELITPQLRGSAADQGYRALAPAEDESSGWGF